MKRTTALHLPFALVLVFAPGMQAQVATSRQVPFSKVASTLAGCTPAPCTQPASVDVQVWDDATSTLSANLILTEPHRGASPGSAVVDDGGNLTFLLGSQLSTGLPPDQFTSGSSRFLDVVDPTTGASVLTGSRVPLNAVAFSVNPGPKGDQGIQGPPGQQGPPGPNDVSGNLTMVDSTATAGNILKGGVLFLHNFGSLNTFLGQNAGNQSQSMTGSQNTASGYGTLLSNTTGSDNTAVGTGALRFNTTGSNNTASGWTALSSNTTGFHNTAVGSGALQSNTAGFRNTATGFEALGSNTTGNHNTANGYQALVSNTTGGANTASGFHALLNNTTGGLNTANGNGALGQNTTGDANTASGVEALVNNTTGSRNAATGFDALVFNTSGDNNTASGFQALQNNSGGNANTAIGSNALLTNTTGSNNLAVGANADVGSGNLSNATAIGFGARVSASNSMVLGNGNVKVGIGTSAPTEPLEVVGNVRATSFLGSGASLTGVSGLGSANTFTAQNLFTATPTGSAVGQGPLFVNPASAGAGETLFGVGVGGSEKLRLTSDGSLNLSGSLNSSTGNLALGNSTATQGNILKGGVPFLHNFGNLNTFLGQNAGNLTMTGGWNTASGVEAFQSNTTGSRNTASGYNVLRSNTTGSNNTGSGYIALQFNTTGDNNTAFGTSALLFNTTGSNNTTIGAGADVSVGNLTNATAIGYNAIVNASNKIRLGNSAVTVVETSGAVIANGGVSGTSTDGTGVVGETSSTAANAYGVRGTARGAAGPQAGIFGEAPNNPIGRGVLGWGRTGVEGTGTGDSGIGVYGAGTRGVIGSGDTRGVEGISTGANGIGVDGFGLGTSGIGVQGQGTTGVAGTGTGANGIGVWGESTNGIGVRGRSNGDTGVYGESNTNNGVRGFSNSGNGVVGESPNGHAGSFLGKVQIFFLGSAGGSPLCRNDALEIAFCSSSLRYKTDVRPFLGGLNIVHRLRPIAFTWKQGGTGDIGLGAEEVERVEPLLTFRNDKGEIEGVKYNQLSAVFVNAIREQQAQIRKQQQQMAALQAERRQRQVEQLRQARHISELQARLEAIERRLGRNAVK